MSIYLFFSKRSAGNLKTKRREWICDYSLRIA